VQRGRDLAEEAFRRYLADPSEAHRLATEGVAIARAERDLVAESKNECVLGLIAVHLVDLTDAGRHLHRAVRLAGQAGDCAAGAQARVHLAYVLIHQGRGAKALSELVLARPFVDQATEPWWYNVEALVLKGLGRWDEAIANYDLALKGFERSGDPIGQARVLNNRGVALAYRGRLDAAEADMLTADRMFEELGQPLSRIMAFQNLGWVAAQRGDVPAALEQYDRALVLYAKHRRPPATLFLDRCELLLQTGLVAEARDAAEAAIAEAVASGHTAELAEARLRLAEAALAGGDLQLALAQADRAARDFARQRRPAWAASARWVTIQACLAGDHHQLTSSDVRRAAARLENTGRTLAALDARMRAAELALREGRRAAAMRDLRAVAQHRKSGPVWYRALGWQAVTMLRALDGDRAGVRRAAHHGLRLVEEYRESLGASDLRALASRWLSALADRGLRSALDEGRPALVLRWADRSRAAHLRRPPVSPPADAALVDQLAHLRRIVAMRLESVNTGRPDRPDLVRQQIATERSIRDRSRHLPGRLQPGDADVVSTRALRDELCDTVLIEYIVSDGNLHAVTCARGRLRLHRLCSMADVEQRLTFIPFTLRRLAMPAISSASRAAAVAALDHDGRALDELLLAPLAETIRDGPLVIVPTSFLQGVPWSILPSCFGRPVSVAPSATLWHAARTSAQKATSTGTVLICGPDLEHGPAEVASLAELYPDAYVLDGQGAPAEEALRAIDAADLAHIAAHGDFRADNPQFSAIRLADGPVTVYDLERLRRAPRRLILSACDSAKTAVLAGDELLGLAPTFLSLGGEAMVASVVLVPDAETRPLMIDLHRELRAGRPIATALANAQAIARASGDSRSIAAAAAFICIGAEGPLTCGNVTFGRV
jgi:tetratricopeptide (TPR) repeat protein